MTVTGYSQTNKSFVQKEEGVSMTFHEKTADSLTEQLIFRGEMGATSIVLMDQYLLKFLECFLRLSSEAKVLVSLEFQVFHFYLPKSDRSS